MPKANFPPSTRTMPRNLPVWSSSTLSNETAPSPVVIITPRAVPRDVSSEVPSSPDDVGVVSGLPTAASFPPQLANLSVVVAVVVVVIVEVDDDIAAKSLLSPSEHPHAFASASEAAAAWWLSSHSLSATQTR